MRRFYRMIFVEKSILIRLLNETLRMICCVEKTNDTFFQNFSKESFSSKIMTIHSRSISNTNARWIFWKENISDSTWTKTSKNTSTRVRFVIESRSWDTNRMKCCNFFRFQKIQDKIERWISSSICRFRNIEISCTIRC